MKFLERAFPWILLSPVVLPVVIWGGVIYPYLVPKTLLFYAISFVALATFLLLVAYGRAFFWARLARLETWIPAALLALAYIASVFRLGFYQSFWSLFVRGDGLLMLTGAVASFYLILLSADAAFARRLWHAVAIIGSFVAVYGIGEWLVTGGRVGGLLGNAAFFAGYLGIAFFATLLSAHELSGGWRKAAYVGAVLQVVAILLSATRGTILALGVALLAWLGWIAFRRPAERAAGAAERSDEGKTWPSGPERTRQGAWRRRRTLAQVALAAIVIVGGLFIAFRGELAKTPFEPVARIASISAQDTDVASRLFIWKNMVGQIEQHPWLGVGAEHIDYLFNKFYDPTQIVEQWFDRSHNAFLDYAAQYGIGGLLFYVALIASFFIAARRLSKQGKGTVALLLSLLAMTYAVQNFFVFDTISSFWLLLALLAVALAISLPEAVSEPLVLGSWARVVAWPAALVLVLLIIPCSGRPFLAAYDLAHAYAYQLTDVPQEAAYLSSGFALGTYGNLEYGYEAYDIYTNQAAALSGQARVEAYQAALAVLKADFERYPYDARTALYLAHVLSLAPPGVPIDQNLLSSTLNRAISLSPKRSQPWYILVNLSIAAANEHPANSPERTAGYAAAEDILRRYLALVPTLSEPHFVLAQLLYASGDRAGAAAEAAKGKADYTSDLETARRAAVYYETVMDLPDAGFFLSEVVRLDPPDTAAASDLGKIKAYEQSAK